MKRDLVDQGSGVEIMYPDLCKGLNLKPEDLEKYDSPLVGFNGIMVILCGMIRLPMQVGDEEVQVNFIVVEAYSLYTAIGTVSTTLHLKVKYPTQGRVEELVESQAVVRQCLMAAVRQHSLDQAPVEKE